MSDFIGIEIQGAEGLAEALAKVPDVVADAAIDEANAYMVRSLRAYPPYTHVTYQAAYGGWKSEKQRRYVMARISEGTITPGKANRTQNMSRGWEIVGYGRSSFITNQVDYAHFLMSDDSQANMPKFIGWKRVGDVLKERTKEILRRAEIGAKNAIKLLGL